MIRYLYFGTKQTEGISRLYLRSPRFFYQPESVLLYSSRPICTLTAIHIWQGNNLSLLISLDFMALKWNWKIKMQEWHLNTSFFIYIYIYILHFFLAFLCICNVTPTASLFLCCKILEGFFMPLLRLAGRWLDGRRGPSRALRVQQLRSRSAQSKRNMLLSPCSKNVPCAATMNGTLLRRWSWVVLRTPMCLPSLWKWK